VGDFQFAYMFSLIRDETAIFMKPIILPAWRTMAPIFYQRTWLPPWPYRVIFFITISKTYQRHALPGILLRGKSSRNQNIWKSTVTVAWTPLHQNDKKLLRRRILH